MAIKTILGIDIGYDRLKMALVTGRRVVKTASAEMPEGLMKEGRITSRETMADLIRQTMRSKNIRASLGAFVLPNESAYVKNVKMPLMTVDQLVYNLPFEFNDYISGEIRDYVFDYAVLPKDEKAEEAEEKKEESQDSPEEDSEETTETIELMAVGAQRDVIENMRDIFKKASIRMRIAAPPLCTYINLIRARKNILSEITDEYGILDLGYESIRLYMYKNDRHVATRILEIGLSTLDDVLSDVYGVDRHLAHTYLLSNFENCQEKEECLTAYDNIAIELMRAMNFYRFSNPDSALADLWLCGGGAAITPLAEIIADTLDMEIHEASELVEGGENIPECYSFLQAIGITFE